MLRTVRTVIVDEIHAVIGTRRGAHLALSLERLQHVVEQPLLRLGLSATQKPIEDVARWLSGTGGGPCAIVDEGHARAIDLEIEVPGSDLDAVMAARGVGRVLRPARDAGQGAQDDAGVREHAAAGGADRAASQRAPRRARQ